MWDGLAQLIQIVIVLALSLVGIEYREADEPKEDPREATIQRLFQPVSHDLGHSPFAVDESCEIDAGGELGIPLLVTAKAGDIIT